MNEFYIYVYFDPTRDMEAIYVGKGKGNRSHWHLTRIDRHPFTQRIQCIARQGCIPIIERYEELSEQAAFDLEIALIAEIGRKDLGTGTLLNLTNGGEGSSGYITSDETKAKLSAASKNMSDEARAKISAAHKGKVMSDEARAKMSRSRQNMSDETRAKISASQKGRKHSDETKAKLSAAKQNMSDETRAKMSASQKGRVTSDETKAKLSAAKQNMSDETRAKISAYTKSAKWWNNGVMNRRVIECPEGFVAGKLKNKGAVK